MTKNLDSKDQININDILTDISISKRKIEGLEKENSANKNKELKKIAKGRPKNKSYKKRIYEAKYFLNKIAAFLGF